MIQYTQEDVARLLADERIRGIYLCNLLLEKLKKQLPNAKGEIKASIGRAHGILNGLFFDLIGGTITKDRDFDEQIMALVKADYKLLPEPEGKPIDALVFPSEEQTISVLDDEVYGGAHCYLIRECLGFVDGKTQYTDAQQIVQFVQKNDDGSVVPGLQSEQLVLALLDRHQKLNNRFPSEQNAKMVEGLQMFLDACKERVQERIERGVMGELKK